MEVWERILGYLAERPLVFLAVVSLPLAYLGSARRIFPTPRLVALMAVPVAASLAQIATPAAAPFVLLLDGLVLLAAVVDYWTVRGHREFTAHRTLGRIASLGKWQTIELEIHYLGSKRCQLSIVDDLPAGFAAEPEQFDEVLAARSQLTLSYRLRGNRRGLFQLQRVYFRVRSAFGLWRAFYSQDLPADIHVYPDLRQIAEFDLLARTNRLNLLGMRVSRKVGQDNEFERLRDYSLDDNYRHIDWRTTARRQKLTVRDFQANQNQQILFLVDCGRMMTGQAGPHSLLDHALNAMLMMSYVALRQGDSVGLCLFSDRITNFVTPRGGVKHVNRLLHASFDQHAEPVESRYDEAFLHLQKNCRKRSLVVLITNVIDEINATQIRRYLLNSVGRHLPLAVVLRDHSLFAPALEFAGPSAVPQDTSTSRRARLFRAAVAAEILNWRHQVLTNLVRGGVLCLDVFPEQLTPRLVNQYLEIKVRHLL